MKTEEKVKVVISAIERLLDEKDSIIVAIDGRCASGKTTLAIDVAEKLDCNVFHMDDFFLRPEQRNAARMNKVGENVDHERFLSEVLIPVAEGNIFSYRPYDCQKQALGEPISVSPKKISIIEGSYACHPSLFEYYDIRIFSDVDGAEQIKRITARNGKEGAERFVSLWIPLEEVYFKCFDIENKCQLVLK